MRREIARDLGAGAIAGLIATVPMTVAMLLMHRRLPWQQRYALPPREIVASIAEKTGARKHVDNEEERGATLVAHFGYGTATGAVFEPIARELPVPRVLSGIGYGLAVWAVSYLGLLPALNILKPATKHPAERNVLMISTHVVWGATLGLTLDALSEEDARR
ncbi:MAG TPA: DUF6789 family protein [Chthoniobacterales bacterium]|nr:DUF6789 family protein [Chthoniobacterales bacterium]